MKKTYGIDGSGQLNKGLTTVSKRPWVYRVDVNYERDRPMSQEIMVSLVKGWVFRYETRAEIAFWGKEIGIRKFWNTDETVYHTQKHRVKQITQE
jgi:hypothetical protein